MVVEQVVRDLHTLRADIECARDEGTASQEQLTAWVGIVEYLARQLDGRPCPECGEQMHYNTTLQAHVCSHHESDPLS